MRARLRDVARRLSRRVERGERRAGPPLPGRLTSAIRRRFGRWSDRVLRRAAFVSRRAELARRRRTEEPGAAAAIVVRAPGRATTTFIFFSYRYYHAYHGARAVPGKAILVPTAERDEAIGLGIFAAAVPRRARAHVQHARRARAAFRRSRTTTTCRASWSASARRFRRGQRRRASGRSTASRALRALRRPHRREQGLQRARSTS